MLRLHSSLPQSGPSRKTLVLFLVSVLLSTVLCHCWFIENLTLADDTAPLHKKLDCERYLKQTEKGWKLTLPSLTVPFLGQVGLGGFETKPEVIELAGKEALVLDIAQHHYCKEMNRAIESEDWKRYEEVEREMDKTMEKLTSLTKQDTEKELEEYVSQNYEPIKSMAVGKGSGDAMVELDKAYVAASPYLQVHGDVVTGKKEVGIEATGGEIHAGGDVIGIQKEDKSVHIGGNASDTSIITGDVEGSSITIGPTKE